MVYLYQEKEIEKLIFHGLKIKPARRLKREDEIQMGRMNGATEYLSLQSLGVFY
jgi:hypothetical protein